MTKQDTVLDAVYVALEKWDEAERRARWLRVITGVKEQRVRRNWHGYIRSPRRNALARFITDAVLTSLRELDKEDANVRPSG